MVEQTGINKAYLANRLGMPYGTFKNKLNDQQSAYKFKPEEEEKLKDILKDIAATIETVVGISFNKALSNIVNK